MAKRSKRGASKKKASRRSAGKGKRKPQAKRAATAAATARAPKKKAKKKSGGRKAKSASDGHGGALPRYLVVDVKTGALTTTKELVPYLRELAKHGQVHIVDQQRVLAMTPQGAWAKIPGHGWSEPPPVNGNGAAHAAAKAVDETPPPPEAPPGEERWPAPPVEAALEAH